MPFVPDYAVAQPLRADIDALPGAVLVDIGTNWCGHCQGAQPSVQSVMADSAVPLVKVEDGPGRPLGRSFRVKLWPTLVFLKDGQEVARVVRPTRTDELRQALALLA